MIVRTVPSARSSLRFARRHLAVLVGGVALASCLNLNVDDPSSGPSDPSKETFASGLNVDISKMQRTPSGVYYKDGPLGSGTPFSGLGTAVVSYVGYLKNGLIFQQGDSVHITLANEIVGLQEGLQGMRAGGERLLVVPSTLGFGASAGAVPPNSTLVYDIILDQFP
jgi:FKBP-type peptidyl-prolyl cis-trans isomerase FkpA